MLLGLLRKNISLGVQTGVIVLSSFADIQNLRFSSLSSDWRNSINRFLPYSFCNSKDTVQSGNDGTSRCFKNSLSLYLALIHTLFSFLESPGSGFFSLAPFTNLEVSYSQMEFICKLPMALMICRVILARRGLPELPFLIWGSNSTDLTWATWMGSATTNLCTAAQDMQTRHPKCRMIQSGSGASQSAQERFS